MKVLKILDSLLVEYKFAFKNLSLTREKSIKINTNQRVLKNTNIYTEKTYFNPCFDLKEQQ